MADLSKVILPNGSEYNFKDSTARKGERIWYATCGTVSSAEEKIVTTSTEDFILTTGAMVRIKFAKGGSYNGIPKINVDNTGAYSIVRTDGATTTRYYWSAGEVVDVVFDGSKYIMSEKSIATTTWWGITRLSTAVDSTSETYAATPSAVKEAYDLASSKADHQPTAYCDTAASTAAKTATCDGYELTANSYTHITVVNANTAQSALTLSINSKTAKPIYINGTVSSSSNYTLPAGTYIVFYDGTNYYFRTDGKLPADIQGDAGTVNSHTVNSDVPSNAVFTDTTALGSMTGTLEVSHGGTGATTAASARTNLGLGSAATASTASSVGNNSNLPTGAAVQAYVTSTVSGKANSATTLAGYGITDAYTKSETSALLTTVYKYKGTKATYSEITGLTSKAVGDVWYCTATSTSYAWNGSSWNTLGISLSGFYTGVIKKSTTDIS